MRRPEWRASFLFLRVEGRARMWLAGFHFRLLPFYGFVSGSFSAIKSKSHLNSTLNAQTEVRACVCNGGWDRGVLLGALVSSIKGAYTPGASPQGCGKEDS